MMPRVVSGYRGSCLLHPSKDRERRLGTDVSQDWGPAIIIFSMTDDQSLSRKTVHPFINYTKDGWRGSVAAEAVLFFWLCVPICRRGSSSLPASSWRWDGDHPAGLRIRMCGPGSVETWAGLVVGAGSLFFEGF